MRQRFPFRLLLVSLTMWVGWACTETLVSVIEVGVVEVRPDTATIFVDDQVQLQASVTDEGGNTLSGREVRWLSEGPGVAAASDLGVVQGLSPGVATIAATSEGVRGTARITVLARPALHVDPDSAVLTLVRGDPPQSTNISITNAGGGTLTGVAASTEYEAGPTDWLETSLSASTAPATLVLTPRPENLTPGTYRATVRVTAANASNNPLTVRVRFELIRPAPANIAVAGGDDQSATVAMEVSELPSVLVTDANGAPVEDVAVTWAVASGGGSLASPGPVLTNSSGIAVAPAWRLGTTAGPNTLTATAEGLTSAAVTFTATAVAGAAAKLAIATPSSSAAASGAAFAQQPAIQLTDGFDNPVAAPDVAVTVAIASGDGSLAGTLTVATSAAGLASFTNLSIIGAAGERTLEFTAPFMLPVTSLPITILAGAAAQLSISMQPSASAQTGTPFAVQPVIQLLDGGGNTVAQAGVLVTAAISSGGGTLQGNVTASTDAAGVATFSDLAINGIAGARTVAFSAPGLPTVESTPIQITSGPASRLSITTAPPVTAQSGSVFSREPVIQLRDDGGNAVAQAGIAVTATIVSGGGTLGGTAMALTDAAGAATFTDLWIAGTAGDRRLEFSAAGLAPVRSDPIAITTGAGTQLSLATQPSASAQSGMPFAQQPVIQLRDAGGNAVGQAGVLVTASIASGGGTLGGTLTATTNLAGVATFLDLKITGVIGERVLQFNASVITPIASDPITITPGPAAQLSITTQQSATAQSGSAFAQQPVVQLRDESGNAVSEAGVEVSAAIANGGGTLGGDLTATTNAAGAATFTDLSIAGTVGDRTLLFTAAGMMAVTSNPISIAAGPASPGRTTATVPTGTATVATVITINVRDAHDNPVTGQTANLVVNVTGSNTASPAVSEVGDGSYSASYTPTAAGTDNVAITLGGVAISGSPYTSNVNSGAPSPAQSDATVPNGTAGSVTSISIRVRDANNNPVSGQAANLAVSVTGANTASPAVTDNGDGTYAASYTPTAAGTDNVSITLGGTPISGSPYASIVSVGTTSPAQSDATVPSGTAGSATTISITVRDANSNPVSGQAGNLAVSVSGSNTAAPAVSEVGGGVYSASYTPAVAGTDNVAITLNGSPINGSPYPSNVSSGAASPAQTTATVPNGTAGSVTTISITVRDANSNPVTGQAGNLAVSVSGSNTAAPAVSEVGGGVYSASYTPAVAGTDNVAITLNGIPINGSPYTSNVSSGAASPAQTTATVPNGTAGSVTTISITVRDANNNPVSGEAAILTVAVSGANTASPAITDNGAGTYTASYTPTAAGTDNVAITLGGAPISGSPYPSTVSAGAAAPAQTTANVPGGTAGSATTISITVRDAHGNPVTGQTANLVVNVAGSNAATPAVSEVGGGVYSATYTPTAAGTDNVAITLGGVAINGSPYTSIVSVGTASPAQSDAVVPNGTAGSVTTISIRVRDANSNPMNGQAANLAVSVTGANTASPSVTDNGDGTYAASYTPTAAGTDNVSITLGGTPISGSPYNSIVSVGAASPAQSQATVPDGTAGSVTTISITVRDANGNPVTGQTANLVVNVTGSNTASPAVSEVGNGSYSASYTPSLAGTDNVAITLGGVAISGSPYTSNVNSGAPSPAQSDATVPNGTAGSVTSISIRVRDANNNPVSGQAANLAVSVTGTNTASPAVTDNGDGTYAASYTPTAAGTDNVSITLGGTPISGSPYASIVSVGAASPAQSDATVPSGTAGSATTISITVRDANSNPVSGQAGSLDVQVTGANTASPSVTDNGDGTYAASYTPIVSGTDNVSITLGGVEIGGSPYTSIVGVGAAAPAQSDATVAHGTAGSLTSISITVRDANSNPVSGQAGNLAVSVSGSNTAAPAVSEVGGGVYSASYTPAVAGTDNVAITLNGIPINGSPYTSNVSSGTASPAQTTATVPNGTAGSVTTISITVRDANNNPVSGEAAILTVAVSGANTASPAITDNGAGTYTASYTPTAAGTDNVAITLGGAPISGSPYPSTVSAGAAAPAQTTANVPGGTAGNATTISITVRDAHGNPVTGQTANLVVNVAGSNTATPAVSEVGGGVYSATYTPTAAGTDNVAITLGGVAINGSPYTSIVSVGTASPAQSDAVVPNGTAGSVTSISIRVRDANSNPMSGQAATLAVSVTGANAASPSVTDNGDGTYAASYTPTAAGTDNVSITLGGTPISGSPYNSIVSVGAASPAQSQATVPDGTAGSVTSISINVRDANGNPVTGEAGNLAVAVTGANTVNPAVSEVGNGSYSASYTPSATGTDNISVTLGGAAISGSPYSSTVFPGGVSATSSSVVASPIDDLVANGTDASTVSVVVRDEIGNPIGGLADSFSVTLPDGASMDAVAETSTNGTYMFKVTSTLANAVTILVTVSGTLLAETPTVNFVAGPIANSGSSASASPATGVAANGLAASIVTVTLADAFNNPVTGLSDAQFVIGLTGSAQRTTVSESGASGTYTFSVTNTVAEEVTVTVTAGGVLLSQAPTIEFVAGGIDAALSTAVPDRTTGVTADGTDASTVTVTLVDSNGNPIGGVASLDFTIGVTGTGVASAVTETATAGTYTFTVTNTTAQSVTVTVTASGSQLTQQPTIGFVAGAVSASQSTAVPDRTTGVTANGTDASTVTVALTDANGNVIGGLAAGSFTIGVSGTGLASAVTETATAGTYTFSVTNTTAQTVTVTITASGVLLTQQPTIGFVPSGVSGSLSTAVADRTTGVTANGTDASTVTVSLKDANSNPIGGLGSAAFTIGVTGTGVAGAVTETATAGTYTFTVTNASAEQVTVTVSASGVQLAQQPVIEFVPGAVSAASTAAANPATGVTADGVAASTVTVTVTDANGNEIGGLASAAFVIAQTGSATAGTVTETATPGTYSFTVTNTVAETVTMTITVNTVQLTQQPTIEFVAGEVSAANSNVSATPTQVVTGN